MDHRQAILACNHPITDQGNQTCYPIMLCANKLSQHVISQFEAREARHTIPACSSLDNLSQHAVGQLKAREARHAIPAYTVQAHYPSMHCKNQLV